MSSIAKLISQLGSKGIKLWLDEESQLRFKAPKGALTADLKAQLIENKPAIIGFLQQSLHNNTPNIERITRDEASYPLSFSQQRFWFLDRLQPGNPALHIPAMLEVKGKLNIEHLSLGLNAVIAKHESLRTFFGSSNNQQHASQFIAETLSIKLAVDYDLSQLSDTEQQIHLQTISKDEATAAFDLGVKDSKHPPFLRVKLAKCAAEHHVLFICLHHIIADGWSLPLIIRDWNQCYNQLQQGQSITVAQNDIDYIDFSHWQQRWMQSDAKTQQEAYWKEQLEGVEVLDLPSDYKRANAFHSPGDNVSFDIDSTLAQQVETLAQQLNVSSFSFYISVFHILLHKLSGQHNFCIGTPVANRHLTGISETVGCFINLLSIRYPNASNFQATLKNTHQNILSAQENQDIPFDYLAEQLVATRSEHSPIFQVLFTLANDDINQSFAFNELDTNVLEQPSYSAKYDLQLHINNAGGTLQCNFEYNSELFSKQRISLYAEYFTELLTQIIANPEADIAKLSVYSSSQRHAIFDTDSSTCKFDLQQSLFKHQTSNNTAIIHGSKAISYQELYLTASSITEQLLQYKINQDSKVGLLLPAGMEQIAAIIAVIQHGSCYVPMDVNYPQERLQHMASSAALDVVICLDNSAQALFENTACIDISQLNVSQNLLEVNAAKHQSALYYIFTSGSTGLPKAAGVSYANANNLLNWFSHRYGFNEQRKTLLISSFGFDLTQKNILATLIGGGTLVFDANSYYDPQSISQSISDNQVNWVNCAPSAFYPIVQHCTRINRLSFLSSLDYIAFGGEPIDIQQLHSWLDSKHYCATMLNMYGPTECTDISTCFEISNPLQWQGSAIPIGQHIEGVKALVLDDKQQPLPVGALGELYITGKSLGLGYLNNDEQNAQAFYTLDNGIKLYRTRDLVRFIFHDNQWQLVFVSRADDQIKIRGFRVELGEIIEQLQQHSSVAQATVISTDQITDQHADSNEEDQTKLIAYIVAKDTSIDRQQLRQHLSQHLPDYMLPHAFVELEQLPLSANGKINKKALPKPQSGDYVSTEFVAPQNITQEQLCDIFSQRLGVVKVGIYDNFFELGGHSLTATKVLTDIQETFGIDLQLRRLFETPRVFDIAECIDDGSYLEDINANTQIEVIDRNQPLPMSFAQQRLWVIEQINPGNAAYNIPTALRFKGVLNQSALTQSLEHIVARHESLRTRFNATATGDAVVEISSSDTFKVDYIDASHEQNPENFAQQQFQIMANTAFDLQRDALFKASLIKVSNNEHILSVCMHHIIADGWSMTVMQQELAWLYPQYNQGLSSDGIDIPALPHQYVDFAHWQKETLSQEQSQQHLDFWVNNLSDAPKVLNLPFDRPRPAQQSFNGGMHKCFIDSDSNHGLRKLSKSLGTTYFNILLATYAVLLNKLSHQDDICIGTPVAGREVGSLESLIGFFVNAVVLRCNLKQNPSFHKLLQRIQDTSLAAFNHQDIPIEQVLDNLAIERNISHAPVAQVGFSFINEQFAQKLELDDLDISYLDYDQIVAKYELTLIVIDHGEEFELNFEYNSDLFDADTIIQFQQMFSHLLTQLINNPEQNLRQVDLLPTSQLQQILGIQPDNIDGLQRLSSAQYDLVSHQIIRPETLANTLGYRSDIDCAIDIKLWQQALQILAEQQPLLRSHFHINPKPFGDIAYASIQKHSSIKLEVIDKQDQVLDEKAVKASIDDFIYQPEQYTQQKFVRFGLLQLANDKSILLMSAHHALFDGISIVLVARATLAIYKDLLAKNTITAAQLPTVFEQHVTQDFIQTDNKDVHQFWQPKLAACDSLIFTTAAHTKKKQCIEQQIIDSTHWDNIKQFCRKNRFTPAQYFKILYCLLVQQYCRHEGNFYITEFSANRNRENAQSLGCYFKQTPFIVEPELFSSSSTIADWFKHIRQYRKDIKPYDAISASLTQKLSQNKGLSFMYNYYHFYPSGDELNGKPITPQEMPAFVDEAVQLVVKEKDNHALVDLYYCQSQFSSLGFIKRLVYLSEQLLQGKTDIANLYWVDNIEKSRQRYEYNQEPSAKPFDIVGLIEEQANTAPEKLAVNDGQSSLSYQQLQQQSNQLANYLKTQGLGSHSRIAICLDKSCTAIVCILATVKIGAAYIPIDSQYPGERIKHILDASNAELVILKQKTVDNTLANLNEASYRYCVIDDSITKEKIATSSNDYKKLTPDLSDTFYIIFTSGSTGKPKGAAVLQKGVQNLLPWYIDTAKLNTQSRVLIMSALGFDLTQKNVFAPLCAGASIYLNAQHHYDAQAISEQIQREQLTHINCAPSALYSLVQDQPLSHLSSLQQVILGGESIQLNILQPWLEHESCHAKLTNHYGPTECTDIALFHQLPSNSALPIPLGKPNHGVQVYLLNEHQKLLPQGLVGEICIAGLSVGAGYINENKANKQFIPNPFGQGQLYKTGDLGRYLDDGCISFIGRKDHQVKLHGLRIELEEITHHLKQQEHVNDALVIVDDTQKLVAYAISENNDVDTRDWQQALQKSLPEYMVPAAFIKLKKWPLTPHGKIDRKQLPEAKNTVQRAPFVAPSNDVETFICQVLENILQVSRVGIHDNFFELGGHSLAASRAIIQIREHFEIELPLNVLFDMQNVEQLASYIKAAQWAKESQNFAQENDDENRESGFI